LRLTYYSSNCAKLRLVYSKGNVADVL